MFLLNRLITFILVSFRVLFFYFAFNFLLCLGVTLFHAPVSLRFPEDMHQNNTTMCPKASSCFKAWCIENGRLFCFVFIFLNFWDLWHILWVSNVLRHSSANDCCRQMIHLTGIKCHVIPREGEHMLSIT